MMDLKILWPLGHVFKILIHYYCSAFVAFTSRNRISDKVFELILKNDNIISGYWNMQEVTVS
jgi:hypothetical protein